MKINQQLLEFEKKLYLKMQNGQWASSLKADQTVVTELDLFISSEFEELAKKNKWHFYSEENYHELIFPGMILDPIDGTKELVKHYAECAVSLALMNSSTIDDPQNFAWIYNPFTRFRCSSEDFYMHSNPLKNGELLYGMVSRSEFDKGWFKNLELNLIPRGSIAFKLGLLASGACDFVLSVSAKNIWDIAAGTILLEKQKVHLYKLDGTQVFKLDEKKIKGPLLWCREDYLDKILPPLFKYEKLKEKKE